MTINKTYSDTKRSRIGGDELKGLPTDTDKSRETKQNNTVEEEDDKNMTEERKNDSTRRTEKERKKI